MLSSGLARLDLVPRAEFDVQAQVLLKTREKLDALEKRLAELESAASPCGSARKIARRRQRCRSRGARDR